VVAPEKLRVSRRQHGLYLPGSPEEELAFFPLAICVLRGVEATLRRGHLAYDVIERLFCDMPVEGLARHQVGMQVEAAEQGVIIEHLLKVRHQPPGIYRVAVKPATELVIDAPISHVLQRSLDDLYLGMRRSSANLPPRAMLVDAQQEFQRHGIRKLGGVAKTAVDRVKIGGQFTAGIA